MLVSDPRRTGPDGISTMEILVHLRREMTPDDLERNTIRDWGITVSKSYTGCNMEWCKNPGNGSSPLTNRRSKSSRGSIKGSKSERKILTDVTGRNSGPSTVGDKTCTFCLLEYKRMSDVWDRYLIRVESTDENQYVSRLYQNRPPLLSPPSFTPETPPVQTSINGGERRVMRRRIHKIIIYMIYRMT
jgi:hypothetical protein